MTTLFDRLRTVLVPQPAAEPASAEPQGRREFQITLNYDYWTEHFLTDREKHLAVA